MYREYRKIIFQFQQLIDLFITAACFVGAYFAKRYLLPGDYANLSSGPNYYILLLLIIIIWYLSSNWAGLYGRLWDEALSWFFVRILKAAMLGMLVLNVCLFFMHITDMSRLLLILFFLFNVVALTLFRWALLDILKRFRAKGHNIQNVLIVGSRVRAQELIRAIEKHREAGYRVLGCFDPDPEALGKTIIGACRVLGQMGDLKSYLEGHVVDELIFAMDLKLIKRADYYVALSQEMGVRVRIVPDWQMNCLVDSLNIAHIRVDECAGIHTLTLQSTPENEGLLFVKSLMDFFLSGIFLILGAPIMAGVSLAIYWASPGPILFRQERMGQNGRRFQLLKFRTMVVDADKMVDDLQALNEADGPAFKIAKDPRIIPWVGAFLRKTSLDELPQLINVLKGEMSLVGPRPPIPFEVEKYETWQRRRLSMKPGLTCIWQIAPRRNDLSFEEWMRLDLEYIDKWSLGLDFSLLVKTARAVLTGAGR